MHEIDNILFAISEMKMKPQLLLFYWVDDRQGYIYWSERLYAVDK
jgi:hypothetical protein